MKTKLFDTLHVEIWVPVGFSKEDAKKLKDLLAETPYKIEATIGFTLTIKKLKGVTVKVTK